jgi:hypothetical protein
MATASKSRLRWFAVLASVLAATFVATVAPDARAVTVLIDDGQCGGTGGAGQCTATNGTVRATAYQITDLQPGVGAGWLNFQAAFNSWNASLNANSQWTLVTANLSAEATFAVTTYRAYVGEGSCVGFSRCGGAEIEVHYNNGGNPPNPIANVNNIQDGEAVWSQSIFTNQKRNPSLPGNPYLDNAPGTPNSDLGPPAYPFQYDGSMFYDMPSRDAYAVWLADLWISTLDNTNRVLTVYDGIEWGFAVETPLPAAWTMMLMGMLGLGFTAFRRRMQHVVVVAA